MLYLEFGLFVFGLFALIWGSDYFVKSSASIAEKLGMSEFLIGLTLVALGTSIPELASSVIAAVKHESGIVIGNIVGSNIANIGLVIGITASFVSIKTEEKMLIRDGFIMLAATFLFYAFLSYGYISRVTALLFLLFYIAYIFFLFETREKSRDEYHFKNFINYFFKFRYIVTIQRKIVAELKNRRETGTDKVKALVKGGVFKDFIKVVIGSIGVFIGAHFLVKEAIFFADYFSVPSTIMGITLIGFGTSVPELSVSLTAARKGFGNIAVGNIIGSNIANILLVGGVAGLISPLLVSKITILLAGPFMLLTSILLLVFLKSGWKIHRVEGLVFILFYAIFIVSLFYIQNQF